MRSGGASFYQEIAMRTEVAGFFTRLSRNCAFAKPQRVSIPAVREIRCGAPSRVIKTGGKSAAAIRAAEVAGNQRSRPCQWLTRTRP